MLRTFLETILDILFPISKEEEILRSLRPEDARMRIRSAPNCPIENASAIFAYKDPLATALVWNIKYKKELHSAKIAAFALNQELSKETAPVFLVPIPITNKRRKERGYNQCEFILDELRSVADDFDIRYDLLTRTTHRTRQTLKNRNERLEGAKGIFSVNETTLRRMKEEDALVLEKKILIIDDVITTGSTVKEAMGSLRRSGFKNVRAISIAH